MRWQLLAFAAASACSFDPSGAPVDARTVSTGGDASHDAASIDARPDAPHDAGSAQPSCVQGSNGCAATCAELGESFGSGSDGVTLYAGGNLAQPWTAFCSSAGLEYLDLTGSNYSQYTKGNGDQGDGSDVRETFAKVRIVPGTPMALDIADLTFAGTNGGELFHSNSGPLVTTMPYGVAMSCDDDGKKPGVAALDLTGTRFAFIPTAFAAGGNASNPSAMFTDNNQVGSLSVDGKCAWYANNGIQTNPFNPSEGMAGGLLPVVYQ